MGVREIILIVLCSVFVVGVAVGYIIRKKRGKTSCDCGCDCGGDCARCAQRAIEENGEKKTDGR